jgi:hypothetical protein
MKIKTIIIFICLATSSYAIASYFYKQNKNSFKIVKTKTPQDLKDGDIIFQTSQSAQCEAVRIATNSKFSHCGIIYIEKGKQYVYEAVQPVKITPLNEWITHGKDNNYVIKRLKGSKFNLTPQVIQKMKNYGNQFYKKDYDLFFEWSDDKIYCSELVWKIYKYGGNIELCELERLKSFNLKDPKVKSILAERYGNNIPLEEKVVAPSQIENSSLLETVIDTY